jgi:hypothetical protein
MRTALTALLLVGCNQVLGIEDTVPPPPSDFDHDGIGDDRDNCPTGANADQADADHDGFGDACDPCPVGPQSGNDGDHDGIDDACDACLAGANHEEDGDGTLDGCDVCPGIAGDQADGDGDGLGDECDPDIPASAGGSPVAEHRTFFDSFDPRQDGWQFGFEHWVTADGTLAAADAPPAPFHGPWNARAMVDGTNWIVGTQIDVPPPGADNDTIGLFLYRPDGSYVIGCALVRSGGAWYAAGTASAVPVGPSVVAWMYAEPAAGGIQVICRFDQSVSYVVAYLSTQPYYPAITGVPGARFHWFDVGL